MSPAGNPRDQKFMLTFTADEKSALEEMARDDGLPAATWLRQLMLKEHRRRELEGQPIMPTKATLRKRTK